MRTFGNAIASSVGRKVVLGVTGLLLVGFLVEHLHGNLKLLEDPTGDSFDDYVAFLQGFGPLLVLAEIGLACLFLCHVYLAFRLTLENWQARKHRYSVYTSKGASSPASLSMFYSGAILLAYIVKHIIDFRLNGQFLAQPAAAVKETLSQPWQATTYAAAALVLGLHLSHGLRSALQSIGISHPGWNRLLRTICNTVAFILAVGFAAVPIYLVLWTKG